MLWVHGWKSRVTHLQRSKMHELTHSSADLRSASSRVSKDFGLQAPFHVPWAVYNESPDYVRSLHLRKFSGHASGLSLEECTVLIQQVKELSPCYIWPGIQII